MPSFPFPESGVLVLDGIGKNVSGAGMDTNIVGRGVNGLLREARRTTVRTLYVRGLTPETHGNAVGMGLADVVSTRLVEAIDPLSTYTNALSAMTPAMVRTPMHFASDAECLSAALRMSGAPPATARIVRVRNTLALDRFVVSPALASALRGRDDLRVVSPASEWAFDPAGGLPPPPPPPPPRAAGRPPGGGRGGGRPPPPRGAPRAGARAGGSPRRERASTPP